LAALLCLTGSLGTASGLERPNGDIVLTVSGEILTTNHENKAVFDLTMLQSMNTVTFTTQTIWTEGPQEFTGVSLHELLSVLGADARMFEASAINDYTVEIPATDAVDGGPIVAFLRNGRPMSARDKGPLWIVYPFDQNREYQSEQVYARSIWQLDRLAILR